MSVNEVQDEIEIAKAKQFVVETPQIDGIDFSRIEVRNDHTGDPSMWLVFRVHPDLNFDLEAARRFNTYVGNIQTKILHAGLRRFPYTRLEGQRDGLL
jgi:hypothetical protein